MNPKDRLREVLAEARALHTKGALAREDAARFDALTEEAESLQAQIKTGDRFAALDAQAQASAGMLPLAGDAPQTGVVALAGLTAAGKTAVEFRQDLEHGRYRRSIEILDQYGEGIQSTKSYGTLASAEYRDAFKTYLRKGERHVKAEGLKVLQEGIDSEGGFSVPPDILERVIAKEPTPTRVAGRVTQLQTNRDKLVMPRINYTSDDLNVVGVAA